MRDLDLHNSTLKLTSTTDKNFDKMQNFNWKYEKATHFFIAEFQSQIFRENNNYTFSVSFTGYTKEDNIGFYRASYHDSNNTKK